MGFWITLAVWAAFYVLNKYMTPSPKQNNAKKEQFGQGNLPVAQEGAPVPLYWGRVRIRSPNVVWFGGVKANPIVTMLADGPLTVDVAQISAYEYVMTLQIILGVPNGGGLGQGNAKLKRVWVGEKEAWRGSLEGSEARVLISQPNMFGGFLKGGQFEGELLFYSGTTTQTITDEEFLDIFDEEAGAANIFGVVLGPVPFDDLNRTLMPSYRGQTMVIFNQLKFGESPNLEPLSFEVQAGTGTPIAMGSALFPINGGDANPAIVLWDILTSEFGGLAISTDLIDAPSFHAAGQTLCEEQHGFSMVLTQSTSAQDLIKEILAEIDGVLFCDPSTRKYTLRLVREDYNVGDLPLLDPGNVLEISSWAASTWGSTYNEVRVIYTDREGGYVDRTAVAQDAANIAASNDVRRSVTHNYPGITNGALASAVASRELHAISLPLAKARVLVNREFYTLQPASVVKLTWPEFDVEEMVFRVQKIDFGTLDDGKITLELIQDRWAVQETIFEQPDPPMSVLRRPTIIEERLVQEAPRWLLLQAMNEGRIVSPDVQKAYYLAVPEGQDDSYRAQLSSSDGVAWADDTPDLKFPMRAIVETTYARTLDPYDTSTGLRVDAVSVGALQTASSLEIRTTGKNLILVGNEIMAYETFTNVSGTIWRLNNVWRGLLDTVPVDHVVGERIYFLSNVGAGINAIGQNTLYRGDILVSRLIPSAHGFGLDPRDAEVDDFLPVLRTALPYPVADLTVDGTKAPDEISEEGVTVQWRRRDRLSQVILRGTEASQIPEMETTHTVMARIASTSSLDQGTAVAVSDPLEAGLVTDVPLAAAGHGLLDVLVRTIRPTLMSDDTVADLPSYQDPTVQIVAPHWRNLLLNPRFADGTEHWTVDSGIVQVFSDSPFNEYAVGNTTTTGEAAFHQIVDVSGYIPERLIAVLNFYSRMIDADVTDTITVTLSALDEDDVELISDTYGPAIEGTTWRHRTIQLPDLPAATRKLRVDVAFTADGEFDSPSTQATEFRLRLGQITTSGTYENQLLRNPGFEDDGGVTPLHWSGDNFSQFQTVKYEGTDYTGPTGSVASGELYQVVSIPTGFDYGVAVMDFARMNGSTLDRGEVILEVLDASDVVMDSVTTGTEFFASYNTWYRRELTIEVPGGAAKLKARCIATRLAGSGACNAFFDGFNLRVHKHLSPDWRALQKFDTPSIQYLPTTHVEWVRRFSDVPVPNYAMFYGDLSGGLGYEADLEAGSFALANAKFVGCWDGSSMVTTGYEFLRDGDDIHVETQPRFANFTSSNNFTVLVVLRAEESTLGGAAGICGRMGTTGWSLELNADGTAQAKVIGSLATKTVNGTTKVGDGGIHYVTLVFDYVSALLHLIDEGGDHTVSLSGTGQIRCDELVRFRIGRSSESQDVFPGQLARVYMWNRARNVAEIASLWNHATDVTGLLVSSTRTNPFAVVVGDEDGILVSRFSPTQHALAYRPLLATAGETGRGLPCHRAIENLATESVPMVSGTTGWSTGAGIFFRDAEGVEGFFNAVRMVGNDTGGAYLEVPLVNDGIVRVVWFARADVATVARLVLLDDTNDEKGTYGYGVTTEWVMYEHRFTEWDGATANGRIRFAPSVDGTEQTIYLSGPVGVSQDATVDHRSMIVIPLTASGPLTSPQHRITDAAFVPPDQFINEGEIQVTVLPGDVEPADAEDGTFVAVRNTTNTHNQRILGPANLDQLRGRLVDASSANNDATFSGTAWDSLLELHFRWNRAELLDAASENTSVVNDDSFAIAYGTPGNFTVTTEPMVRVDLGHLANDKEADCIIRRVILHARERKLPLVPT